MALAETTYVDPSALLKLYVREPESPSMNAWRTRTRGALPVTHHGHVEVVNGICLAAFRGDITAEAMKDSIASFDEDFEERRYVLADLLWRAALKRAGELSREFTLPTGCRSLDVLHVASALELQLRNFLTFDQRQQKLVRSVGLKLVGTP